MNKVAKQISTEVKGFAKIPAYNALKSVMSTELQKAPFYGSLYFNCHTLLMVKMTNHNLMTGDME